MEKEQKRLLLELDNVSSGYDGKIIINSINLKVYDNDFTAIIGPNGGGKTTLIKTIVGLITPTKGEIRWNTQMDSNIFGYLPQINQIDRSFPISVLDVVLSGKLTSQRLFKSITKEIKLEAMTLLEEMGVAPFAQQSIGNLSGGQLQRVFLCRSLINHPQLLILDEPNTYVDTIFEQELYEKLSQLNKKMAILMVSHDIGTVTRYVKKVACVNKTLHFHGIEKQEGYEKCPASFLYHSNTPLTLLKDHNDTPTS
ncbi:ABC transporter ATP-binding protein [Halosquirtibacter xylanolyticus]|uniref:metal ABC transporter ATP-binding protein n=1 Tax=Halosquirtibacter xylanolyticus TaxID=3374599 RepID=UPI003748F958|nr:ABC transporter ATP-binding protein [Prolixibacteraceae bacterium]